MEINAGNTFDVPISAARGIKKCWNVNVTRVVMYSDLTLFVIERKIRVGRESENYLTKEPITLVLLKTIRQAWSR